MTKIGGFCASKIHFGKNRLIIDVEGHNGEMGVALITAYQSLESLVADMMKKVHPGTETLALPEMMKIIKNDLGFELEKVITTELPPVRPEGVTVQ